MELSVLDIVELSVLYSVHTHPIRVNGGTKMDKQTKIEALKDEIESLIPKAESGEQWAHICQLEAELVKLVG